MWVVPLQEENTRNKVKTQANKTTKDILNTIDEHTLQLQYKYIYSPNTKIKTTKKNNRKEVSLPPEEINKAKSKSQAEQRGKKQRNSYGCHFAYQQ